MTGDVLVRLKAATAAVHQRVEGQVRFLDAEAPLSEYAAYLGKLLGFHAPLETQLLGVALPPLMKGREKVPLIERDLQALGVDPAAISRCPFVPAIQSLPQALGCAYVMEGATLGGKHVLKRMAGRVPADATAYLGCYGPEVGARWNAFREVVRGTVDERQTAACIDSAVATFEALSRWLEA